MVSIFNIVTQIASRMLLHDSSLPEQRAMTAEEAAEINARLFPIWAILCAVAVLVFLVTIYLMWKDAKS